MPDIKNPLSAESYTNKDFQTIYVELLETAKMLAKNWDPTISNESDPGVVLLKLNAIIADKNNYNIDKNVLENYPETYTQEMSARSQYKQLGYKMPWYRAATTKIGFKWVGDPFVDGDSVTIPKHTMLMDAQGTYIFTILEDATLGKISKRATDTCAVPAIQGTINTLKLAGSTVISLSNLDSKNRLYINDQYIAENGVFVTSADDPNGVLWTQVDNVELEGFGTKCYEFDIDPRRNIPYLQFPEDMRNLIQTGIIVKYIVTNGYNGNVAAKTIDTFYDQGSVELIHNDSTVENIPLTSENFLLYNLEGTINGQDPEDIDSAVKSFKKTVCTFDTLVTLRDYMNAIYTFGKEDNALSNVIVTDRTNDIQSHYRIIDKDDGLLGYVDHMTYTPITKFIETNQAENIDEDRDILLKKSISQDNKITYSQVSDIEDATHVEVIEKVYDMSAFDLKFYVLKTGGLLNTLDAYAKSFTIDNSEEIKLAINGRIQDSKSVQHDVVDIKKNIPFMLQNVYPIKIKLVPTFKLNDVAKTEVINNIKTTLINLLNSRNCEFGEEPSYDIIYDAIISCDERIKVLILDDFKYTTFATYLGYSHDDTDGDLEFKYIPISDYSTCSRLIVRDGANCNCENSVQENTIDAIRAKLQEVANKILKSNSQTAKTVTPTEKQIESYRFIDSVNGIMYKWPKKKTSSAKAISNNASTLEVYSRRLLDIRTEIIARNILAGVTPLFETPTNTFNTALNMNQIDRLTAAVSNIGTELTIAPFGFDAQFSDKEERLGTYKLRANESLRFLAPSFISDRTYANYVKYELVLKNPVLSNSEFTWADPQDEENILKTYGNTHFYIQNADNVYSPLYGSAYVELKDIPTFKLNYHHKINRGYGKESKEIISNSNHFRNDCKTLDAILDNVKPYIPEYERYLYYKLENDKFQVIKHYYPGFRNDLEDHQLYRLKHFVEDFTIVDAISENFVAGRYYIDHEGQRKKISDVTTANCSEQFIYDCICNYNTNYNLFYKDGSSYLSVDDYTDLSAPPYYIQVSSTSSGYLKDYALRLEKSQSPRIVKDAQSNSTFLELTDDEKDKVANVQINSAMYSMPIYMYSNVVDSGNCDRHDSFLNQDNPRFELVKKYSSNIYIKMMKNNQLVGYKVVQSSIENDFKDKSKLSALLVTTYNSVAEDLRSTYVPNITAEDLINSGLVVVTAAPATWQERYKTSYLVKYLDHEQSDASAVNFTEPSAPPDYTVVNCLEKKTITTNGMDEIRYVKVDSDSLLTVNNGWDDNYEKAFSQENYNGLHRSSPEYLRWKDGSLALYVRKASYRIEANTEYQLREGDYIVFFWRETDEDDAPYTYRKYTGLYDEGTGQPVIIKPSFPIKASTPGTRLFNHDHLKPSGTIPYNSDNNSQFQIIFQKMYDEYDLSGSRQIELRKMNSVKLDSEDKKYYYFICPDKENKDGEEIFSMSFNFVKEWQDTKGITQYRFHHILQPDEYFIYMNADQTLYEILGEGTLIEYNTSNPTTSGNGNREKFEVTAIDSNEILYQGADAFKEYCRTVEISEVFNLIEQQVYSFVKDDVVQISLKDNVGYNYEPTAKSETSWYLEFASEAVKPAIESQSSGDVEVIEPFVYGEYYTNDGDLTVFENFKKVITKPDGWDDLRNWLVGGAYYNKYYKILYANYIEPSKASNIQDENNWYNRINPEYPVFTTNNPLFIKDFNVSYSANKNNNTNEDANQLDLTYTSLPHIDVEDDSYGWTVTAHLNLMCDSNKPQKIEVGSDKDQARQRIIISGNKFPEVFYDELDTSSKEALDAVYSPKVFKSSQAFSKDADGNLIPISAETASMYILSSIPLDKVGSSYIDVSYIDLLGERHDTEIFSYDLNSEYINDATGWQIVDEGLTLRIPANTIGQVNQVSGIKLDTNYKYLLPFAVTSEKVELKITSNGEDLKCLCCDSNVFGGTHKCGKHFIEITPEMDNLTITSTNIDPTNDVHVLFELLFKYKYRDIFGGDVISEDVEGNQVLEHIPKYQVTTKDILAKIKEIDVPGKFKYTHVPSIDVEIKDPLDPASIFNENHVYNQFSIARAELDSAEPYDASYDIVNNR